MQSVPSPQDKYIFNSIIRLSIVLQPSFPEFAVPVHLSMAKPNILHIYL